MRARLALAVSGQACELREVVLKNKPQSLLQASPKATVPVLVLPSGQVLDQSLDIMLWALAQHDPEGWLAPSEGSVQDMLAWIAECDGPFKQALDRCKYPSRYPDANVEGERAKAVAWLS
ncbi:MAG TPA: glutathione S-transferase N-terminal domain-containing protein, partial [Acidovorax sp.]|nr:glutathione S-transferase N-terminal domain-containing protein [Acidovorax sp.]